MTEKKMDELCESMRSEIMRISTLRFDEAVFLNYEANEVEFTVKVSMINKRNSKNKCVAHIRVDSERLLNVIKTLFTPKYIDNKVIITNQMS